MPEKDNPEYQIIMADSSFFRQAIEIYEHSFPPSEKQNVKLIRSRVEDKSCRMLGIVNDGQVLAFAILWDFSGSSFSLLDYFAVKQGFRGRGTGRRFFEKIRDKVLAQNRILLIEAENPLYGENKKDKLRRITFYQNAGARWMAETPYFLPAFDGTEPTPMLILVMADLTITTFDREDVSIIFKRIFSDVYNLSSSDFLLNTFLCQIPSTIYLKSFSNGKS